MNLSTVKKECTICGNLTDCETFLLPDYVFQNYIGTLNGHDISYGMRVGHVKEDICDDCAQMLADKIKKVRFRDED